MSSSSPNEDEILLSVIRLVKESIQRSASTQAKNVGNRITSVEVFAKYGGRHKTAYVSVETPVREMEVYQGLVPEIEKVQKLIAADLWIQLKINGRITSPHIVRPSDSPV